VHRTECAALSIGAVLDENNLGAVIPEDTVLVVSLARLLSQYRLGKLVGKGQYGVVIEGTHLSTQERRAIKFQPGGDADLAVQTMISKAVDEMPLQHFLTLQFRDVNAEFSPIVREFEHVVTNTSMALLYAANQSVMPTTKRMQMTSLLKAVLSKDAGRTTSARDVMHAALKSDSTRLAAFMMERLDNELTFRSRFYAVSVMELAGWSIGSLFMSDWTTRVPEILSALAQMLCLLHLLNERYGATHRDAHLQNWLVKPIGDDDHLIQYTLPYNGVTERVLIPPFRTLLKLADFGLASVHPPPNAPAGTPSISPTYPAKSAARAFEYPNVSFDLQRIALSVINEVVTDADFTAVNNVFSPTTRPIIVVLDGMLANTYDEQLPESTSKEDVDAFNDATTAHSNIRKILAHILSADITDNATRLEYVKLMRDNMPFIQWYAFRHIHGKSATPQSVFEWSPELSRYIFEWTDVRTDVRKAVPSGKKVIDLSFVPTPMQP